jgi:formylglycine-generating enzyme required for sulfatase activity
MKNKSFRGGSWDCNATSARAAGRYINSPGLRINLIGFRLVEDKPDSAYRTLRGGSWGYPPRFLRSTSRYSYTPSNRFINTGFRLIEDTINQGETK